MGTDRPGYTGRVPEIDMVQLTELAVLLPGGADL